MLKNKSLLIWGVSLLFSHTAWAENCPTEESTVFITEQMDKAHYIFEGEIQEKNQNTLTVQLHQSSLKGNIENTVELQLDSVCSSQYKKGDSALFFIHQAEGKQGIYAVNTILAATAENRQKIQLNTLHNSRLKNQNCIPSYNGKELYLPCVKVENLDEIYNVKLAANFQKQQLNFNVDTIQPFQAQATEPVTPTPTQPSTPEPSTPPSDQVVTVENIEVKQGINYDSEYIELFISGSLPNYCYRIDHDDVYRKPLKADQTGHFAITLAVEKQEQCHMVTDSHYTPEKASFQVNIPLGVNELERERYTITINGQHTASFSPTIKEGQPPAIQKTELVLSINDNKDHAYVRVRGELEDSSCHFIARTSEFVDAVENGITANAERNFILPLRTKVMPTETKNKCDIATHNTNFGESFSLNMANLTEGEYNIVLNNQVIKTFFIRPLFNQGLTPLNVIDERLIFARGVEVIQPDQNSPAKQLKIDGNLRNTCQELDTTAYSTSPNAAGDFIINLQSLPLDTNKLCKYDHNSSIFELYIPLETENLTPGYHKVVINNHNVIFFSTP